MDNAHVYSLWLKPTSKVRAELAGIISRLSREHEAPLFDPHVTLIGEFTGREEELIAQTRQLAAGLDPFTVQFGGIEYLDEFYRCLFIRLQETTPLMQANAQARTVFHRESDDPYMPHLSLLYANLPATMKEEIKAQIGQIVHRSFTVDRIHLVSTQGEPKGWYSLGEFAF